MKKILIVDDDLGFLKLIHKRLGSKKKGGVIRLLVQQMEK